ncbi:MAG TPA: LysM peptidoglycan-binding domain-containing protein [Deltaproteobacteria bacterium]|nr:LysM peptidoglycan-binding domain-containing protein [Deltaproteobacteria bacterium]
MKEDTEMKAVVTFSVSHYRFCISAHEVKAIITAPSMSRLPVDAAGVEGVFDYHGKVVTAVSLRRKLGLPDRSDESDVWIISCVTSVPVAFRVDAVLKVVPAGKVEWRQVDGLRVDSVDRYALYENEIFFLTSCKSLLAMPVIPERVENGIMEGSVETDTAEPESGQMNKMITGDGAAIETGSHVETRSIIEIQKPADDYGKDPSAIEAQKNKEASHHSLKSISRKNRCDADRHRFRRESPKQKKGATVSSLKMKYCISSLKKQPARVIVQHDSPGQIIGVDRNFGWKLPLGTVAIVTALCLFLFLHFGMREKRLVAVTHHTLKEESELTGRLSAQGAIAGVSARMMHGDSGPEGSVHLSGNPVNDERILQLPVRVAFAAESDHTAAINGLQAGMISFDKTADRRGDVENVIPAQPDARVEMLRVETQQYTVTVERLPIDRAATESERPTPAVSYDRIIHIVVKGDTLWDIAERYLGDPFRYPQLASLSNIRDPDWIYPGDVVRIVKKTPQRSR